MQKLSGIEYLQADIACKYDKKMEKKTWNERIQRFHELAIFNTNMIKKASNPIGLRAAIKAYNDYRENKPTGYMISLDACSSGLQLLSVLVSCSKSFELCGGNSDECVDSYTTIYDEMNVSNILTREVVKKAIMTAFYGSFSIPEKTFKGNIDLFYDTIIRLAPGAWNLNIGIQELWDQISGDNYEWILPDNFHAYIETKDKVEVSFTFNGENYQVSQNVNKRPDFHKGLGPNLIHSVDGLVVREMVRRCMFNPSKLSNIMMWMNDSVSDNGKSAEMVKTLWEHYTTTGFLSVRILDYLYKDTLGLVDKDVIVELIESMPNKSFDIVTVHDCFRCHPNYGNDVRKQYNTIIADLNDSNLLNDLVKQIAHSNITVNKVGKIDRNKILEGNYLLA
jgi:hypothetical protein